jgi:hypothetical protein
MTYLERRAVVLALRALHEYNDDCVCQHDTVRHVDGCSMCEAGRRAETKLEGIL